MKWIHRTLENELSSLIRPGKVFILSGPRRVGKTMLLEKHIKQHYKSYFIGSGDDLDLRSVLSSQRQQTINSALRGYDLVFIDEAQRIPDVGLGLKILTDSNPDLKIVVSGSSSLELSNSIGEPLTGRQINRMLFPISVKELHDQFGSMFLKQNLHDLLIYGSYPELFSCENNLQKSEYLLGLRNAYLFKDILELENIRNPDKLNDLLKLIAFQIGNEVSLNELSNSLGIAKQTVERYLELLEKAFVIIKVRGYSNNLRKEVSKTCRYYFWDNGIRNAVINNFNESGTRMDMGMLWENFCFIERIKKQSYEGISTNNYFWRTYDGQEIDMIEERNGKLMGYEFKWNPNRKLKVPSSFVSAYKNAGFMGVTPENYLDFLL